MSGINYEKDGFRYVVPSVDVTEVYNDGFANGKAEGKAECVEKHFAAVVTPETDQDTITFGPVPFEPDMVSVICYAGLHGADGTDIKDKIVHVAAFDLRAINGIDTLCGTMTLSKIGGTTSNPTQSIYSAISPSTATNSNRYLKDDSGNITIKQIATMVDSKPSYGKFGAGCNYICTAVKVTE